MRQPPKEQVFHSDRGSQYSNKRYRKLLNDNGVWQAWVLSEPVGTMLWLNAFFEASSTIGYLKLLNQPKKHMKRDIAAYMKYYNLERLHTSNGDQSQINYENSLKKVSCVASPYTR